MRHTFSTLSQIAACLALAVSALAQPLPKIALQPVFPKLTIDRPVWLGESPDNSGRLFIVAQAGSIYIIKKGSDGSGAREFFNIENRQPYFDNEDGLMSIAFHPGFKTNGLFYVYYNQKNPGDDHEPPQSFPFRSIVSEFKVSATNQDRADLASERVLLSVPQPYGNHKGGEVAFGPDGYLYLGLGDGGFGGDPLGSGQSTSTLLAKMLRIDVNSRSTTGWGGNQTTLPYGIPQDNPFVGHPTPGPSGPRLEIYAYGLRNPWRYSFDRATGDLWVGDVGQELWEAVDLITNGGNYGWSVREGSHYYKPGPVGAHYIEPVMEYTHRTDLQAQGKFPDHSIGLCIIGGYVYRGGKFPSLAGVYVYGDYSLGTIWGFRYDRAARKVTAEGTLLEQHQNIFSFAEDGDGELYALTQNGQIFQVTVP